MTHLEPARAVVSGRGARSHAGTPWSAGLALRIALIGVALVCAYGSSLRGPFVFDDVPSVRDAPSKLTGQEGITVSGRPLLALSFALNRVVSRGDVTGYHATNLLIHVAACLSLFGLMRRTLAQPSIDRRLSDRRDDIAIGVALLWGLHPLQTAAVTYIVQRAESLMGLCFLLTLYCLARSVRASRPARWQVLATLICGMGMATKEVMVTAPVAAALYDRAFLAGSWRDVWRQRRKLYAGLAACWLVLGLLYASTGARGGTAGWSTPVTAGRYIAIQCEAIAGYLARCVWPSRLVFDYGTADAFRDSSWLASALVVVALIGLTVIAWWRSPRIGFLPAWFFLVLAPTSSVVPVASQVVAEHRMYLPLAAVAAGGVVGLIWTTGRLCLGGIIIASVAFGAQTVARNATYQNVVRLWGDTVAKWPTNARGHYNLGLALAEDGREAEALPHYRAVVRLQPDDWEARNKLGAALLRSGAVNEAIESLEAAVQARPDYIDARNNLGIALMRAGRVEEGIRHLGEVARRQAGSFEANFNYGSALAQAGRRGEAVSVLQRAQELRPNDAQVGRLLIRLREEK